MKKARQKLLAEKSMIVGKIRKEKGGWTLFSQKSLSESVFISSEYYQGKMPPFIRFPWRELKLSYVCVNGCVLKAVLNDQLLYKISEESYPQKVKDLITETAEDEKRMSEREAQISKALNIYLSQIPIDPELENKILKMPVCFRAFLQMHFLTGDQSKEAFRRLNLVYLLCNIADRIRRRYCTSILQTTVHVFPDGLLLDDYWKMNEASIERIKNLDKLLPQIISATDMILPPVEDKHLQWYLICDVKRLIRKFVADTETLERNYTLDPWDKRCATDCQDYRDHWQMMELPEFKTLLLPDKISEENMRYFFEHYYFE